MSLKTEKNLLIQTDYDMTADRRYAALFTTGNGYMGVRGSYEEDCELGTQGLYIRGFIDKTIENCTPYYPNAFIKKNYYDDDGLKAWQDTECGINPLDFLTVFVEVGGKRFSLLDGKISDYKRTLDFSTGELTRSLVWDNGDGAVTELVFRRFASFYSDHIYCQQVTVRPVNHSLPVLIFGGAELRTKTMGQIVTKTLDCKVDDFSVSAKISSGEKYSFTADIRLEMSVFADGKKLRGKPENGKLPLVGYESKGAKEIVFEKLAFISTSRDEDGAIPDLISGSSYKKEYERHLIKYMPLFNVADVQIEGNDGLDGAVRFSVYHSLISACRNDGVHGVSAKGLTGEHYHQFVWWDSEIYQMPFFLFTNPETAKNTLIYRYRTLDAARKNARKRGCRGARFAFCSSVTGEECVWSFVKHPFMQDHVVSDVMFAVFRYLDVTDDRDFLIKYGAELLSEGALYWISRAEKTERGYEIKHVTGTDEHHGDVDNDAYTNYSVQYVLERFSGLVAEEREIDFGKFGLTKEDIRTVAEVAEKIYLPEDEYGYIPQFDGYFDLNDRMEENGNLSGLQMRHSGSYAESQVIKQPDVMLLFGYADVEPDKTHYQENFDYYERMCEMSSSLSYAPHAVCAADLNRTKSFLDYLEKTVTIDLKNLHGGVEEGIHAGCEAGGYLSLLFGAFGARPSSKALKLSPKRIPGISRIAQHLYYKNTLIFLENYGKILKISKIKGQDVEIFMNGENYRLKDRLEIKII